MGEQPRNSSTTRCCRPSTELEQKDWDLARQLLRRCGALGLLGVDIPEAYGGVGLDMVSSLIVSERLARSASFGATFGAQANLTILPLLSVRHRARRSSTTCRGCCRRS